MIVFPDEGVNRQELFERVADQFEGAVDVPSLYLAQVEKLVIGSKNLGFWSLKRNDLRCVANPGREIAPNIGANATKFFTLATKS